VDIYAHTLGGVFVGLLCESAVCAWIGCLSKGPTVERLHTPRSRNFIICQSQYYLADMKIPATKQVCCGLLREKKVL
jgi:hypothetical protein